MAEDAEWDAACVAVTDAAERESKRQKLLTAALQKQATAKKARKVKNGGSGGRPKGAAKEEKDRLAESISRLQRDLMPGDIEPEAGPSDGALRVAAAANPTDHVDGPRTAAAALQAAGAAHAHASAASRQAAVAAVASTAAVGEFDGDSDDEDHDEPRGTDALAPGGEDARGAGAAPAAARAPAAAAKSLVCCRRTASCWIARQSCTTVDSSRARRCGRGGPQTPAREGGRGPASRALR